MIANPELTVRSVCGDCNNGWMSALENASMPSIGSMLQDISIPLDNSQQNTIALWATKTAMVVESVTIANRALCYQQAEREQLRLASSIPVRTEIWLGRFSGSSLLAAGTDLWGNVDEASRATHNCLTTLLVGHLAIQVMSVHVVPEYCDRTITFTPKVGPWDRLLLQIWPINNILSWPPSLTFTNGGTMSIARLHDRWKTGIAI
jgi:hypothetical protein